MARKANVFPSYLLHQPTGQARVRINGKDRYLGEYGSEASRILYGELVAKHAGGIQIDPFSKSKRGSTTTKSEDDTGLTINELVLAFKLYAEKHYTKDGKPTSEMSVLSLAWNPLIDLYGFTPVDSFGPLMLKSVRQKFVESGWVRNSCNSGVNRIRRIFRWGVENEMIAPGTLQKLEAVAPLLAGRTEAHDNAPRTAVDASRIEAVQALVRPLVRDLIELQRLTGSRSGELLKLTTGMIDQASGVWVAVIAGHKSVHRGKSRTLFFGKRAQAILQNYLQEDPEARLFKMTRLGYSRAVLRACDKAKIERWCPHQMRNTNSEIVRQEFDLEHVGATLGHAQLDMSAHYAGIARSKAIAVAERIG